VHGKVELQMDSEFAETEATPERAERLANLLTLSYEPMLVWRLDGAIEFWNAGAERLYGFSPQEAVGRSSHSLLQTKFPIDFAELRAQLRSERFWSGELRHVRKDGDEVVVNSRMQLLGADTVLEVNRDVTEIKALGARQATPSARSSGDCRQVRGDLQPIGHFCRHHGPARLLAGSE
jgi:PAS domain S-box-containing protein